MGRSVGRSRPTSFRSLTIGTLILAASWLLATTSPASAKGVTPGARHASEVLSSLVVPSGAQHFNAIPRFARGSFSRVASSRTPWNHVARHEYVIVDGAAVDVEGWFVRHRPITTTVRDVPGLPRNVRGVTLRRLGARSGRNFLTIHEYFHSLSNARTVVRLDVEVDRYPSKPVGELVAAIYTKLRITNCASVTTRCLTWSTNNQERVDILREVINEQSLVAPKQICPAFYVTPTYIEFFVATQRAPALKVMVELGGCGTIQIQRNATTLLPAMQIGPRFVERVNRVAGQTVIIP